MSIKEFDINKTNITLQKGGIIAYPTEAVYGLGCDPFNQMAVEKIYHLKQRSRDKGLILIASSWEQVYELVGRIPEDKLSEVKATWPGPITWIFPTNNRTPHHILGEQFGIAVRVTNHPVAKAICDIAGPIVSTSANPEGSLPAKTLQQTKKYFGKKIDFYIDGPLGELDKPTQIRDALTGEVFRS